MRVLITGAAGFLGSHLAARLVQRGDAVVGIDNYDSFYPRAQKQQNLEELRGAISLVEGDVLDPDALGRAMAEGPFDVVVHLAALAGVRPSLSAPARYQRVNVEGTCRVAEEALRAGTRALVFASSSSVYGDRDDVPFSEEDRADAPVSPYAASKRAAELVLRAMSHAFPLDVTVLRYFTVYGPRQRPEMAVHAFCRAIERGEPVRLFGDGRSSRDYTYVDDAIDGTVAAIERAASRASAGAKAPLRFSVYNLGGAHATPLDDLAEAVARQLGRPLRIERAEAIAGDVRKTFANIEAAGRDLGYAPRIPLEEGLARFVTWFRAQRA